MERDRLARLVFTTHALRAMAAREVEVEDVVDAILRPDVVEPHEGRVRYVKDGIAYVVAPLDGKRDRPVLVTVLLRTGRQWTDADARTRRRK